MIEIVDHAEQPIEAYVVELTTVTGNYDNQ